MESDQSEILDRHRKREKVPGAALALVNDDSMECFYSGRKSATGNEPVREDTLFEAASLSKPVFSCLVMDLVVQGMFSLDTPAAAYAEKSLALQSG